jgi:LmbE family N-acetylglucosaminyl deacetylase
VAAVDELPQVPEDWARAVAVVAHPDDLEYGAAAAVARWTDQGKDVRYVMVTRGEAGIRGLPPAEAGPLRSEEQLASAAVVGVSEVEFLDHPDGTVQLDLRLRRDLARVIRRHRPEVVIASSYRETWGGTSWNHADHRAVGIGLIDAARDAANEWIFPELAEEGLAAWDGLRFIAFAGSTSPTHGVDVTDHIDRGVASLREHKVYLEALGQEDPTAFLHQFADAAGPRLGVEKAVLFELVDVL